MLVGLPSPGLRSNGYTLARHVLLERAGRRWTGRPGPGADHSLADELLRPSVIYAPAVLAAAGRRRPDGVHAAAHITGGGIAGNLARVLPARLRRPWSTAGPGRCRGSSTRSPGSGQVADEEMARVFNLGLGMVLAVRAAPVEAVLGARWPALASAGRGGG